MNNEKTLNAKSCENEIRFMLDDKRGRLFLWRLIVEACHVFDVGFQHNAAAYSLLAKQDIGKILLNAAREIDLEKIQLAEREYHKLLEESATEEIQKDNFKLGV